MSYSSSHNFSIFSSTKLRSSSAARLQLSLATSSMIGPTSRSYRLYKACDIIGISAQAKIFLRQVYPTPACTAPAIMLLNYYAHIYSFFYNTIIFFKNQNLQNIY